MHGPTSPYPFILIYSTTQSPHLPYTPHVYTFIPFHLLLIKHVNSFLALPITISKTPQVSGPATYPTIISLIPISLSAFNPIHICMPSWPAPHFPCTCDRFAWEWLTPSQSTSKPLLSFFKLMNEVFFIFLILPFIHSCTKYI